MIKFLNKKFNNLLEIIFLFMNLFNTSIKLLDLINR